MSMPSNLLPVKRTDVLAIYRPVIGTRAEVDRIIFVAHGRGLLVTVGKRHKRSDGLTEVPCYWRTGARLPAQRTVTTHAVASQPPQRTQRTLPGGGKLAGLTLALAFLAAVIVATLYVIAEALRYVTAHRYEIMGGAVIVLTVMFLARRATGHKGYCVGLHCKGCKG
jgi:hypothetical protein